MNRTARSLLLTFAVSTALVVAPTIAWASAGDLDHSFGGTGKVVTDLGMDDHGYAVAVQANGKVVVVGDRGNLGQGGSVQDFAVVRYTVTGTLDTTFGGGDGRVTTGFGGDDLAQAVAIQPNGKIVVAGTSWTSTARFALARYNANGTLDTTFGGGDGKVTTSFPEGDAQALGVAIQSNGRIVVAGTVRDADYDFALARYTAGGSLDTSFSGDGRLTTSFGKDEEAAAVAIDPTDQRIVAVGWTGHIVDDGVGNFAFARYTSSGALDTSFGAAGTGKVVAGFGGYDIGTSVAMEPNGQILAAGFSDGRGTFDFAVMKLTAAGRLQKTFGHGGGTLADFGGDEYATGIALQSNGKVVVGGWRDEIPPNTYAEFAIMRLDVDGTLDTTFGSGGGRVVHVGDWGDDGLGTVAIDPSSGKILQAGYTYNPQGGTQDFATVRYLAS